MMRSTRSHDIVPRLAAMAAFAALLGTTARTSLAAVGITTCGQHVPADEIGVLQADLDCASTPGIVLEERGTLDFAGHRIADAIPYAIRCAGNICTVQSSGGSGEITGNAAPDGPDVLARAPRFSAVTCGTSQRLRRDPPVTLGVCAND